MSNASSHSCEFLADDEVSPPSRCVGGQESIGLIAGNGIFPLLFAKAAKKAGVRVVALALVGETEPALAQEVSQLLWVKLGELKKMVRYLQQEQIHQAAMAGGVRKSRLFSDYKPDFLALKLLAKMWIKRDDGLLRAIARVFEEAGIQIVDSTCYLKEALTPPGVLTSFKPTAREWQDLYYGAKIALEIGKLDIGQTVVVKEGVVVALEALEGTDACIIRAGELTGGRGAVVVKMAKPVQDMRFDVPAVGVATLRSLVKAGVRVLGLEAGRTLLLEPEALLQEAQRLELVIVGLTNEEQF